MNENLGGKSPATINTMPPKSPPPRRPERQNPRTEIRNRRKETQESPRIWRRDPRTVMADVGSLERMGRELKCPIWHAAAAAAALLRPAFPFAFLDPYYFVGFF